MLYNAIADLEKRIEDTALKLVNADPSVEYEFRQSLYALISAINVLEIYEYGRHRTKYSDYTNK